MSRPRLVFGPALLLLAAVASCSSDDATRASANGTLPGATHGGGGGGPAASSSSSASNAPSPSSSSPQAPAASPARRVVLFIGDGMGINVMTASRIFAKGESGSLTMDTLPQTGFVRTYSHDSQVTDSAAAMTAYVTGVKGNNDVLSMTPDTPYKGKGTPIPTILELAEKEHLATGVVTTTRVTHATPAATYAHVSDRDLEDVIAAQLAPDQPESNPALGDGLEVVMGGGIANFLPKGTGAGARADGRDLVAAMKAKGFVYADSKAAFDAIGANATRVLGLFTPSHMSYELDRDPAKEPSLAEMSVKAVDVLAKNPRGFFLMVEGGRIDHALHATNAKRALADTVAFDDAIGGVLARLRKDDPNLENTLVVVTADHDHTMMLNGYAKRTGPTTATLPGVLGLVRNVKTGAPEVDADGQPYSILGFGNGENRTAGNRKSVPALTEDVSSSNEYHQEAVIRMGVGGETHGGTDVAIMAIGKGAEAVHGSLENTDVFEILRGQFAPPPPPPPAARAKNVLFFLGDGMGPTVVTAGRIYGKTESGRLAFEKLEHTARIKTFSNDAQTTDSAPSMSAYMTGTKANNDVISMSSETVADKGACTKDNGKPVPTLLELAKAQGKAVGAVTTTEATHATPAATYAHICHRDLAYDIAVQAVPGGAGYNASLGGGLDVLMGGARNHFTPLDPAQNPKGRPDGRDLLSELLGAGYAVVKDRAGLTSLAPDTKKVVGLFSASSHLAYELDRDKSVQPSIAEMTTAAIDVLERASAGKGWFLMVEGGRIDHALHGTNAKRALEDLNAFDGAVEAALGKVNLADTLVVVTADHDHTMVINGYAKRGNSILDVVRDIDGNVSKDADGFAYPVLAFGNGENRPDTRTELTSVDVTANDYHQLAGVRMGPAAETHGGGDVMLFATGAGSAAFHGTIDNTHVFAVVKAALGL